MASSTRRRRSSLLKHSTDILQTWFQEHLDHPYPTEEEKQKLITQTGLSINQLNNWLINARRRYLPLLKAARDARVKQANEHTSSLLSDPSSDDEDQPLLMAPYQKPQLAPKGDKASETLDGEDITVSVSITPTPSSFRLLDEHDLTTIIEPLPLTPPLSHEASSNTSPPRPLSRAPSERDHILPSRIPNLVTDQLLAQATSPAPPCYGVDPHPPTPIPTPAYREQETYWDVLKRRQHQLTHLPVHCQYGHRRVTCEEQSLPGTNLSEDDSYCNEHCDSFLLVLWKVLLLIALLAMFSVLLFCLVKLGVGLLGVEL